MAKATRIDHALHNAEVCEYLCEKKEEFADWVIITAFYSALHYVDHKIFPLKEVTPEGHKFTINNIDQYRNIKGITKDKHAVRADLVRQKCPDISVSYEWLKSICWTARYSSFVISNAKNSIKVAKEHLNKIAVFCNPVE